jgi:peptidoglycan hydrolase-like protein with peptidoglycan-binding domain
MNSAKNGPATTPQPTPEPNYISDGMPPQPFRKLVVKSSGEDVYWLQMKLKELGYYTGTVTGTYYSGTKSAVKKFQKDAGIYPSGEADVKTLEALYADILAAQPTPEPTVKPEQ